MQPAEEVAGCDDFLLPTNMSNPEKHEKHKSWTEDVVALKYQVDFQESFGSLRVDRDAGKCMVN